MHLVGNLFPHIKKIFTEHELEELELLKSNNESKSFYRKLKRRRKDFQPRTISCRDKNGVLLSEENYILRRWAEHFDELLNIECSNQNATTRSKETCKVYLDTDEPTPILDEAENAIQRLNDNKAPGMDLIQAELIKKASPNFVESGSPKLNQKIGIGVLSVLYTKRET